MELKPEDAEDEQEAVVSPGVKQVNNSHWSVSGPNVEGCCFPRPFGRLSVWSIRCEWVFHQIHPTDKSCKAQFLQSSSVATHEDSGSTVTGCDAKQLCLHASECYVFIGCSSCADRLVVSFQRCRQNEAAGSCFTSSFQPG